MQVKLLLFAFYLNGRLHAVSIRNRLNGCQIFGRFGFLTESEPNRISVFRTWQHVVWLHVNNEDLVMGLLHKNCIAAAAAAVKPEDASVRPNTYSSSSSKI